MSDDHEPTMEEILASIRRIISEDDVSPSASPPAGEAPLLLGEDDVLTSEGPGALNGREALAVRAPAPPAPWYERPAAQPASSEAGFAQPAPAADSFETGEALVMNDLDSATPAASAGSRSPDQPLLSPPIASSVASSFEALERGMQMPPSGRTLEDAVRDMLRPMLKTWLEENLPAIVSSQVAAEVERIARLRR